MDEAGGPAAARLDAWLDEDAPFGDLTTDLLAIADVPGRITFAARDAMVLAGAAEAAALLRRAGAHPQDVRPRGTPLAAGETFLVADGPAGALHRTWKVAQTLVEHASGIATRARRVVDAAGPGVVVACTRKSVPGAKALAVDAVRAGGAVMHRLGLSETVLVFPEHRAFLDGEPAGWLPALKARAPERKIVVETDDVADAVTLVRAGADVLQLEKLSPAAVEEAVAAVRAVAPAVVVAAAGGVDETNAAAYARAGANVLVTSAPFFARPGEVRVTLARG